MYLNQLIRMSNSILNVDKDGFFFACNDNDDSNNFRGFFSVKEYSMREYFAFNKMEKFTLDIEM